MSASSAHIVHSLVICYAVAISAVCSAAATGLISGEARDEDAGLGDPAASDHLSGDHPTGEDDIFDSAAVAVLMRKYDTHEERMRASATIRENIAIIDQLNADPEDDAEYGISPFADVSPKEFVRDRFPFVFDPVEGRRGAHLVAADVDPSCDGHGCPVSMDWRKKGAVTPVKDQSSCGSCWAESAVSNMESQWFLAHRTSMKAPEVLSVQQVIECDTHDNACYGGFPKGAYQYAIESGGLTSEGAYPYKVKGHSICLANQTFNETCGDGICDDPPLTNFCDEKCSQRAPGHAPIAKFSSWVALPNDESAMAAYVAQHGPVSVGIDASGGIVGVLFPWLQFYKRGIANPKHCTSTINHGVVIVGYGEEEGKKYWIVRNSWSQKFGEAGYFRLLRGAGKCGIASMATSAVAASQAVAQIVV